MEIENNLLTTELPNFYCKKSKKSFKPWMKSWGQKKPKFQSLRQSQHFPNEIQNIARNPRKTSKLGWNPEAKRNQNPSVNRNIPRMKLKINVVHTKFCISNLILNKSVSFRKNFFLSEFLLEEIREKLKSLDEILRPKETRISIPPSIATFPEWNRISNLILSE